MYTTLELACNLISPNQCVLLFIFVQMSTNANLQGHVMAIARTQKEGISASAILALRAMLPYQMDVKVTRTRLLLSQLHAKKK